MTGEAPVMQVRYGLQYSLLFFFSGLLALGLVVLMEAIARSGAAVTKPVGFMLIVAGVAQLAMAVLSRRRAYFEVFENRIEVLSPVFPRWRRAKPLPSIGTFALNLHRLVARQEDIERFIAWRDGRNAKP